MPLNGPEKHSLSLATFDAKLADFKIKIPMLKNFNSLNVSNALSIIIFESVRQKLTKGGEK